MLASCRPHSLVLMLATALAAPSAYAQATYNVFNQDDFNEDIVSATEAGRNDIVNINAQNISSLPALMLPDAATTITINLNGIAGGTNAFSVGAGSTAELTIAAGTTINFDLTNGVERLRVGFFENGVSGIGTVNMTGGTIGLTGMAAPDRYMQFDIGRGSAGSIGIFNQSGGTVDLGGGAFQVGVVGGKGTYNLSGNAVLTLNEAGSTTYVGDAAGGVGNLNISGNASFSAGRQMFIGTGGGVGTITQDGAGSHVVLNIANGAYFGTDVDGVGTGGAGTYNLVNGDLQIGAAGARFGHVAGGSGIFNQSGGTFATSGTSALIRIGENGMGQYNLSGGTANFGAGMNIAQGIGSVGTVNQTGGTLTLSGLPPSNGAIHFGAGTGTYNLNGGTLRVGVANPFTAATTANYAFNLGGGTIQALTDFNTAIRFNLTSGTSTVDTTDINTDVTLNGILSGVGVLQKAGDGTLVLNAANSYTGGTWISDGTLQLGALGSLAPTGALQVDAGATFDLAGHVQTIGALTGAGTIELGVASGVLTTNTAATTTFSGDIDGAGGFTKAGSGTLFLTGMSGYTGDTTINGGALVVNGSVADSEVTVNSGVLAGTGTVGALNVESGGTVAPGSSVGASIGTLNVTGPATFQPGSTYQVEVNAAGASDRIAATGAAILEGGIVRVLAQGGAYSPLMTYTILTAAGGVTDEFDGVTSNLVFLTPTLDYDANNVYLRLVRTSADFAEFALTRNQLAVANALDQFPAGSALLPYLLGQDAQGIRQAFDALSGEVHASAASALVMNSFYVREAIFSRLIQAYYSGAGGEATALGATGPTTVAMLDPGSRMSLGAGLDDIGSATPSLPLYGHGLAFWTRGFGAWGDLDGNGNAAGLDRTLGGFISGVDAGLGSGWRAGLATGYMRSDLGVGARASSADIDSYVLAGYAGGGAGPFAIRSGGAWTWNSLDTTRNVFFPGFFENERASYNAGTGQLFAEIAYPVVDAASAWEPFAGLSYVHVGSDGFTESGAVAGLTSDGADQNVGVSLLGVRAGTTLPVYGMLLTPHGSLAWQYAFGDVMPAQAFAFASTGVGFGIAGVPIARSSALVQAGLDLAVGDDAVVGINYTGQIAGDLNDNSVQGRFNWRF